MTGDLECVSDDVLDDPAYSMPSLPPAVDGMGWLRNAVPRFSDGEAHQRRRALVIGVIEQLGFVAYRDSPTRSLLAALGLSCDLEADVALVAAAYQPHATQSAAADAAADRLVAAFGGRTEQAAATACVLVQAHVATLALVDAQRAGATAAPVPFTRRVGPSGEEVVVDLSGAHFGRGPHRCPGEQLARHLAEQALV